MSVRRNGPLPPLEPTAAILDSRTLQSTTESGARTGWDGAKRRKGSKRPIAVDTLGYWLALPVTAADEQHRAQVGAWWEQIQEVTGETVPLAAVDPGYTGASAQVAAQQRGLALEVVKRPEAKKGFVRLPRKWVRL